MDYTSSKYQSGLNSTKIGALEQSILCKAISQLYLLLMQDWVSILYLH